MSKKTILPTTGRDAQAMPEITTLIYVFNRWQKNIMTYGKLDPTSMTDDYMAINDVLRMKDVRKDIRRAVQRCRDYSLVVNRSVDDLLRSLGSALKLMCDLLDDDSVRAVRSRYADQGMRQRYRPLSRRLEREKIRKLGRPVIYTNPTVDDTRTAKLVRRLVEKRAAQSAFHNFGRRSKETNKYRQTIRRAISYSLYKVSYVDYDPQLRTHGTHWKVSFRGNGTRRLEAKVAYACFEDALAASESYMSHYPDEFRRMSPYRCSHCGMWHIGHESVPYLETTDGIEEAG